MPRHASACLRPWTGCLRPETLRTIARYADAIVTVVSSHERGPGAFANLAAGVPRALQSARSGPSPIRALLHRRPAERVTCYFARNPRVSSCALVLFVSVEKKEEKKRRERKNERLNHVQCRHRWSIEKRSWMIWRSCYRVGEWGNTSRETKRGIVRVDSRERTRMKQEQRPRRQALFQIAKVWFLRHELTFKLDFASRGMLVDSRM